MLRCAAQYYHDGMQAHNAISELHLIPLDRQRCYCVGQPEDPSLNKSAAMGGADHYARYCASKRSIWRNCNVATTRKRRRRWSNL